MEYPIVTESVHEILNPDQTISEAQYVFRHVSPELCQATISTAEHQWHSQGTGPKGVDIACSNLFEQLEADGYQFFGGRQHLEIPMATPGQTRKAAQVSHWWAQQYSLKITCEAQTWQGSGDDLLAALKDIRQKFEPAGYRLLCYGTSLNCSASGMSYDSGQVYQLEWGPPPRKARKGELHHAFETGADVIPATDDEQQRFKERWHAGVQLGRDGMAYDLEEYPVVAVNHQGHVTRCDVTQNLVVTAPLENLGLEMVFIPRGTFLMGETPGSSEITSSAPRPMNAPQHEVRLAPFWFGKYPITRAQWQVVASLPQQRDEMRAAPWLQSAEADGALPHHPVSGVSGYEALEFCARLSVYTGRPYRLPTEAEWEYACKAGTMTPFHFGEATFLQRSQLPTELATLRAFSSAVGDQVALLNYDSMRPGTTRVGSYLANAWGVYDLHGNVWEWCMDHWHDDYNQKPEVLKSTGHRYWKQGHRRYRVLRGGAWRESASTCSATARHRGALDDATAGHGYGLRVVCESC
ncbi:MAG: formylglycine-generating enzyme family protein [Cyanobacteria bacterium P01_F01_bin.56]